jgi:hypothetical protein
MCTPTPLERWVDVGSRWDPYNLFGPGPPWSVQAIIESYNWGEIGGMQCLTYPLVPLPPIGLRTLAGKCFE